MAESTSEDEGPTHGYSLYKRIMRRLHFDFQIGWSIGNNGPNPTNPLVVPVAFLTLIKRLNNFSNSSAIVTVHLCVCVFVCLCVFCICNCCRFFTVQIRLKGGRGKMEKYGKIANNWAVNNVGCQGSNSFEYSSSLLNHFSTRLDRRHVRLTTHMHQRRRRRRWATAVWMTGPKRVPKMGSECSHVVTHSYL